MRALAAAGTRPWRAVATARAVDDLAHLFLGVADGGSWLVVAAVGAGVPWTHAEQVLDADVLLVAFVHKRVMGAAASHIKTLAAAGFDSAQAPTTLFPISLANPPGLTRAAA